MARPPRVTDTDLGPLYAAVEPVIDDIERFRRGHLIFFVVCLVFLAVPAFLVGAFAAVIELGKASVAVFEEYGMRTTIVGGVIGYVFFVICTYGMLDRDYRRRCKRKFNRRLTEALGLRYSPGGTFNPGSLYPHYVLPPYARAIPEDSVTFFHNKRKVEIQEARFLRTRTEESHIFNPGGHYGRRGLMIRIWSRRLFAVHTLVVPKRWIASDRDRARFMGLQDYERVPFGNRRFSRKYYVMSKASDEAHFVFDPAFIERILAFEQALGAKSLSLSFMNDEIVFFADHGHDFMEAGHLMRPVTLASVDRIVSDLRQLTDIIDYLELNPYTGV
jgi:hypothetical protein